MPFSKQDFPPLLFLNGSNTLKINFYQIFQVVHMYALYIAKIKCLLYKVQKIFILVLFLLGSIAPSTKDVVHLNFQDSITSIMLIQSMRQKRTNRFVHCTPNCKYNFLIISLFGSQFIILSSPTAPTKLTYNLIS